MFYTRIPFLLIFPLYHPIFGYDWTNVDVGDRTVMTDPLDLYNETGFDLTEAKKRYKRAASVWENTKLDLSIGTDVADKAKPGDSYDFTLRVQFPEITVASPFSVLTHYKLQHHMFNFFGV